MAAVSVNSGRGIMIVGKPSSFLDFDDVHVFFGHGNKCLFDRNRSAARYHPYGSDATLWWMFGGHWRGSWGAAEDDIVHGEAEGDCAHRPGRSE